MADSIDVIPSTSASDQVEEGTGIQPSSTVEDTASALPVSDGGVESAEEVEQTSTKSSSRPQTPKEDIMKRRVFVGNIGRECTEADVRQAIGGLYGDVETINIVKDFSTRESKGYGFITFVTADSALACIEQNKTNSLTINDRRINFRPAKRNGNGKSGRKSSGGQRARSRQGRNSGPRFVFGNEGFPQFPFGFRYPGQPMMGYGSEGYFQPPMQYQQPTMQQMHPGMSMYPGTPQAMVQPGAGVQQYPFSFYSMQADQQDYQQQQQMGMQPPMQGVHQVFMGQQSFQPHMQQQQMLQQYLQPQQPQQPQQLPAQPVMVQNVTNSPVVEPVAEMASLAV
eukprot:m.69599 g.69599  ORF g.69599 m.69599 type:complete len:339 (+) comp12233_c0_seq2:544-1560(+)